MDTYQKLSLKAATFVASQIILKPDSVLGLATGATPLGMYRQLVTMYEKGLVDFKEVTTFNLDEYLGLDEKDPQSYSYYMHYNFFQHVNIEPQKRHIPRGQAENRERTCREYDEAMDGAGGIDLQILGVGLNGHIGFNEPDCKLQTATHVVQLTQDTIKANSRYFECLEQVPRQAISMGMASIMQARKVLLLASGASKKEVIQQAVGGEITTECPVTLLQLHPDVTIMVDKEAAPLL